MASRTPRPAPPRLGLVDRPARPAGGAAPPRSAAPGGPGPGPASASPPGRSEPQERSAGADPANADRLARLKAGVQQSAENRPGVYRMLGPGGRPLYVGKSVRLRSRLLSYFRAGAGEKAAEILGFTERVEWDDHASEFSALLAEFREIRRARPPFNVQHKKERAVCFIRIPREPAARVLATTRPLDDGSEYRGPLLGAERVRGAVRVLVDVLELRDCPATTPLRFADQADLFGIERHALCPRADFGRCLAPCAGGCTERGYARRLEVARSFLGGGTEEPLERLRRQLDRAVRRWLFEYAAVVAERIELLAGVRDSLLRMEASLDRLTGVYRVPGHDGDDRLYLLRRGRVEAGLRPPRGRRERLLLRERVGGLAAEPAPGPGRLGPDAIAEMLLVERWFRRNPGELARVERAG